MKKNGIKLLALALSSWHMGFYTLEAGNTLSLKKHELFWESLSLQERNKDQVRWHNFTTYDDSFLKHCSDSFSKFVTTNSYNVWALDPTASRSLSKFNTIDPCPKSQKVLIMLNGTTDSCRLYEHRLNLVRYMINFPSSFLKVLAMLPNIVTSNVILFYFSTKSRNDCRGINVFENEDKKKLD